MDKHTAARTPLGIMNTAPFRMVPGWPEGPAKASLALQARLGFVRPFKSLFGKEVRLPLLKGSDPCSGEALIENTLTADGHLVAPLSCPGGGVQRVSTRRSRRDAPRRLGVVAALLQSLLFLLARNQTQTRGQGKLDGLAFLRLLDVSRDRELPTCFEGATYRQAQVALPGECVQPIREGHLALLVGVHLAVRPV